ncbi:hypothetical protein P153DRAFT_388797 [Dothidotthia symphoricarpi CBS 119687]|uniref:Uncharacterized protein n=1 Tax=Dothidotthia symphoricarpi CBS 119687 TaxID=1392245 RepID=A0A6A6A572_9PLEO|nr:uncharacterized protein P153DRAFT_388797 [Dothidotthia symphoricarpi CBS 119687]KAF2126047.1 hypothetical protein P153DRAFT_388797 [Dothidotthia symphoricarpi CBS 119687]
MTPATNCASVSGMSITCCGSLHSASETCVSTRPLPSNESTHTHTNISANDNSLHVSPASFHEPRPSNRNEQADTSHVSSHSHSQRIETTLAQVIRMHYNENVFELQEEVRTTALQEAGQELDFDLPLQRYENDKWQLNDWVAVQSASVAMDGSRYSAGLVETDP